MRLLPETQKLLTLSMLKGVGPATLRKLIGLPTWPDASPDELGAHNPQLKRALEKPDAWERACEAAAQQLAAAERHGAHILSPFDTAFPSILSATNDHPCILYVRGTLATPSQRVVAVVGTREPTGHGAVIASRISADFAEHGWSIVSGLALGCDASAHQASVDAGAHTVAVLAHGLQTVTPTQHRQLADNILASGGALVSEFPFGQEPQPQLFARRDRTQAGLAEGVIMVQSGVDGGSLHACRAALSYGRWVAVPYPTERDRKAAAAVIGANLVLAEGSDEQRTELIACETAALKRVMILRDRSAYDALRAYQPVAQQDPLC